MSLPLAIALLALVVSVFAVLAAFGVYARLRLLERTALSAGSAELSDEEIPVPQELWPGEEQKGSLVLLLDGACPICGALAEAVDAHGFKRTRTVALFATEDAAATIQDHESVEKIADLDLWSGLTEGYAPSLFLIGPGGRILDRRFVYADTDLYALLTEFSTLEDR